MYELMWNTTSFMDKSIFPDNGQNPFVYSMNIGYVPTSRDPMTVLLG